MLASSLHRFCVMLFLHVMVQSLHHLGEINLYRETGGRELTEATQCMCELPFVRMRIN